MEAICSKLSHRRTPDWWRITSKSDEQRLRRKSYNHVDTLTVFTSLSYCIYLFICTNWGRFAQSVCSHIFFLRRAACFMTLGSSASHCLHIKAEKQCFFKILYSIYCMDAYRVRGCKCWGIGRGWGQQAQHWRERKRKSVQYWSHGSKPNCLIGWTLALD